MLRDHFHPPLRAERPWESFHSAWATYIAENLSLQLPEFYVALPNAQFGIEIDVSVLDAAPTTGVDTVREAAAITSWCLPRPTMTVAIPVITDIVEVKVFNNEAGPELVAAIEIVSPANKDRPEHREAFAAKCAALLHQGIGLMIIDIVTNRNASLHLELIERLHVAESAEVCLNLYSASYHPVGRDGSTDLDIWLEPLAVGSPLLTMPLFLRGGPCLPVDLAASYERTCSVQRIA